ncbi:TFIIH/NER complex subunit [Tilletia horrida]|uniref:TFIIH/NER complex subunit n=1 Tax=Tilletia horrida TaxID=155126 RepID=A0AAN6GXQ0_9BASI|nr:TFIIH/NER complex subunit [Tilletia horrida]KAK0568108.1 TFIIH/NER complex subunit [Tilletia horrida]
MSRRGVSSRNAASLSGGHAGGGIGGPSSRAAAASSSSSSSTAGNRSSAASTGGTTASAIKSQAPSASSSNRGAGGVGVSRVATRGAGVGGGGGNLARVHDPSRRISEYWSQDDKCPICKTDRLISPKLRLLVDTFALLSESGANHLGVEREVDVRRRVAKIYNKQEKDFPTLQAYNDYLEEVEEITFNLINKVDLDRTEARIAMHEHANRSLINRNAFSSSSASAALASAEEAERSWRKARADLLRRREEEDRAEKAREERELMDLLASEGAVDEDEDGEETEAVRALRAQQMQRRKARAESRRREDEEAERQQVAMMGALAALSTSNGAGSHDGGRNGSSGPRGGSKMDIDITAGIYRPWQPEMLLDFEGPLARLDDARAVFDVPHPPALLLGLKPTAADEQQAEDDNLLTWLPEHNGGGSAGKGLGVRIGGGRGYIDFFHEQPRAEEDAKRVRAGGYDWREMLRRRMRAANEGLWIAPVADASVHVASAHGEDAIMAS